MHTHFSICFFFFFFHNPPLTLGRQVARMLTRTSS